MLFGLVSLAIGLLAAGSEAVALVGRALVLLPADGTGLRHPAAEGGQCPANITAFLLLGHGLRTSTL
jgi:hypothetical protein